MSENKYSVIIRGLPENPQIKLVNVRSGPGVNRSIVLKANVETVSTLVLDVEPDEDNRGYLGKQYTWFKLKFPNGAVGWVRDDLLDIQGDLSFIGYGMFPQRTFAFTVQRDRSVVIPDEVTIQPPTTTNPSPVQPANPPPVASIPVAPIEVANPRPAEGSVTVITTPAEPCLATVRTPGLSRIRKRPTVNSEIVIEIQAGSVVEVKGMEKGLDPNGLRWAHIVALLGSGYMREDLLSFSGACSQFDVVGKTEPTPGAPTGELFPAPTSNYIITNRYSASHKGWDFASPVGTPVMGWDGGTVVKVNVCQRCLITPNVRAAGIPLSSPSVLSDPAWGYGFGNYVIVRYPYDALPSRGKDQFDSKNLRNGFLYASYAHLSTMSVSVGQSVSRSTQIGLSGDTGNSSGPHLHLELRGSMRNNTTSMSGMTLLDPQFFVKP